MSELQQRQQQMLAYLLGQDSAIEPHIAGNELLSAAQRLSIYGSAYRIRLREVIDTDHPVLGIYLGDDLFDQMVDGYISSRPSQFRSLRQYCDPLPEYLRNASFFSQYPQIAELARFERMLLVAFDAEDKPTATPAELQQLAPELWPELRIRFHPSLQIFISQFNVVETWQAIKGEQAPPDLQQEPVSWVLWRNQERLTEFRSIDPVELTTLNAFLQGDNFTEVAERIAILVGEDAAAETLLTTLLRWLELGWIWQLNDSSTTSGLNLAKP